MVSEHINIYLLHNTHNARQVRWFLLFQHNENSVGNEDDEMIWCRPSTLNEFLKLKMLYKNKAKIVVGNTELGVEMRAKRALYPVMIQPTKVGA